jgi:HD-GYP domain-containing protein (c-di-GMP phosphodiesterase class II)
MIHAAREGQTVQSRLIRLQDDQINRVLKSDVIPLQRGPGGSNDVLAVLQDITDLMTERERRETVLRSLVSTLVAFLDRRDPYSAYQSVRVAEVAVAIAQELEASEKVVQTVDIAGNLMNLGKILVPAEILTKVGDLSEEERDTVRESMFATANLLEGVKFDLPVAETLRQLQEHWDGSGQPRGLSGTAISEAARIVAVANAFVGMVSPRAYRSAIDFNKAVSFLLEAADHQFDRKPISALINYLENHGGRERWQHFADIPDAPGPSTDPDSIK